MGRRAGGVLGGQATRVLTGQRLGLRARYRERLSVAAQLLCVLVAAVVGLWCAVPVPAAAKVQEAPAAPREIVARYPNHVWSVDRTRVMRWGLWPTWLLVAIDHFSRAVMAVVPLEGPNAGWVVEAVEDAFVTHGAPRYLMSDQEGIFISDAFRNVLVRWDVKQRLGAVGKHGSIAVTERVILTLKYEWLQRVPVIRGLDHLSQLLQDFAIYYNEWRGHTTMGGAVPSLIHRGEHWSKPEKSAKAVPATIERRFFPDTQITAYRLAA